MSEVKHTPGPWTSQYDDNGFFFVTAAGQPSPYVAATGGEGGVDAANARLIAAAPDLLRVVSNLLVALTEDKSLVHGGGDHDDDEWFIDHCRAALAKVEA